ncbi:MAG: DUF2851 family protein [Chitinophagaceae bacterium]|nr:DUF2851 family protein [Chitinophagaceae bacterium]
MTERLLQYIWQFQYFNSTQLKTVDGEDVQIVHPGIYNINQGPDFLDAKIKIGETVWAGSIELHCKTSEWNSHNHTADKNYNNVIAHVVWENDIALHNNLPTIILNDRVSKLLLGKYEQLLQTAVFIPCESMLKDIPEITWISWKHRLLVERLEQKSAIVFEYLKQNNNHWEETFLVDDCKKFWCKVNAQAFEKIAQSIPLTILAKHKNQIHQIEALLFGQAGLLQKDFADEYPKMLKKEYQFYNGKYSLPDINVPLFFLRMRPANFPTVRLAQLAALIVESVHLFSKMKEITNIKEVRKLLNVTANDYWHYHYTFEVSSAYQEKKLGSQMINNIIINTVVPAIFAYGHYHKDSLMKEKALRWLEELYAENNTIINKFAEINIEAKTAFDTQALIQLKNEYCNKKRCLDCAVGNKLIGKG